ncbi:hypothetical protein GCM10020218_092070 [Dactylosporangium vinaceum]
MAALGLLDRLRNGHIPGLPAGAATALADLEALGSTLEAAAVRQVDGLAGSDDLGDVRALVALGRRADSAGVGLRLAAALRRLTTDATPTMAAAAGAVEVLLGLEEPAALGSRVASWVDSAVNDDHPPPPAGPPPRPPGGRGAPAAVRAGRARRAAGPGVGAAGLRLPLTAARAAGRVPGGEPGRPRAPARRGARPPRRRRRPSTAASPTRRRCCAACSPTARAGPHRGARPDARGRPTGPGKPGRSHGPGPRSR